MPETHRIIEVDPFVGFRLHKLAIQKQFSGRLKPNTAVMHETNVAQKKKK